jgi:hypothetical protein
MGILLSAVSVSQRGCTGGLSGHLRTGACRRSLRSLLGSLLWRAGFYRGAYYGNSGYYRNPYGSSAYWHDGSGHAYGARGVPQAGTAGQGARQAGAEAPHRGTMDRATSADIAGAPLLGEGAQAAQRAGEAAQPVGAVGRAPSMDPMVDRVAGGADSPKLVGAAGSLSVRSSASLSESAWRTAGRRRQEEIENCDPFWLVAEQ